MAVELWVTVSVEERDLGEMLPSAVPVWRVEPWVWLLPLRLRPLTSAPSLQPAINAVA